MSISGKTKTVAILGWPVEHTLSPIMHNSAFAKLKLDYVYVAFGVHPKELKGAVEGIRALGIAGVNVTVPHKESVMRHLDSVSKDASLIGAVNTVCNEGGTLKGYNTDGEGFITSLLKDAKIKLEGKKVVLIGAGGVGKAIAVKLAQRPIEHMVITDKITPKAKKLSRHIVKNIPDCCVYALHCKGRALKDEILAADILINATPLGMHPEDPPVVDPKLLRKKLFVYDVVYNRETELLKQAKQVGAKHLGGLGMLLYQGVIAFELWTGREAPVDIMRKELKKRF
ncbi:MAG: shikimate dehydrogenase [bacterium]